MPIYKSCRCGKKIPIASWNNDVCNKNLTKMEIDKIFYTFKPCCQNMIKTYSTPENVANCISN